MIQAQGWGLNSELELRETAVFRFQQSSQQPGEERLQVGRGQVTVSLSHAEKCIPHPVGSGA